MVEAPAVFRFYHIHGRFVRIIELEHEAISMVLLPATLRRPIDRAVKSKRLLLLVPDNNHRWAFVITILVELAA